MQLAFVQLGQGAPELVNRGQDRRLAVGGRGYIGAEVGGPVHAGGSSSSPSSDHIDARTGQFESLLGPVPHPGPSIYKAFEFDGFVFGDQRVKASEVRHPLDRCLPDLLGRCPLVSGLTWDDRPLDDSRTFRTVGRTVHIVLIVR